MRVDAYRLEGRELAKCSILEWALWYERADNRVALSRVGRHVVSTIFIGIPLNPMSRGRPLVFETAGWQEDPPAERRDTIVVSRAPTFDEALAAHAEAVSSIHKPDGVEVEHLFVHPLAPHERTHKVHAR